MPSSGESTVRKIRASPTAVRATRVDGCCSASSAAVRRSAWSDGLADGADGMGGAGVAPPPPSAWKAEAGSAPGRVSTKIDAPWGKAGVTTCPERHDAHVAPDEAHQHLGGGLGGDRGAGLRARPKPQHVVDHGAGVGAIDQGGFTDGDRGPQAHVDARRERLAGDAIVEVDRRDRRGRRLAEHGDGVVALVHRSDDSPTAVLDDVVPDVAEAVHGHPHLVGVVRPEPGGVRHLGGEQGDHARGMLRTARAAQLLDEPGGGAGTTGGIDRERTAEDAGELSLMIRVDTGVGGRGVVGRFAVEKGDGRRGEPEDVGRRVRLLAGGHLGGDVADRAEPALAGVAPGDVEVDQDDAAVRGSDDVGGLDVSVDDRRLVPVEMVEGGGDLGEIVDHVLERKAGVALLVQHLLEVGAVDPVHDHHVSVALVREEVAPDHGKPRMRVDAHQEPCLGEQLVAVGVGHWVDLQGDQALVDAVEGLEHGCAPALADGPQHLVARAEELVVRHVRRPFSRPRLEVGDGHGAPLHGFVGEYDATADTVALVVDAELVVEVAEVGLHGVLADVQALGDLTHRRRRLEEVV